MVAFPNQQKVDSREVANAKQMAALLDCELTPNIGEIRQMIADEGNCPRSDSLFVASLALCRVRAAGHRKVERLEGAA